MIHLHYVLVRLASLGMLWYVDKDTVIGLVAMWLMSFGNRQHQKSRSSIALLARFHSDSSSTIFDEPPSSHSRHTREELEAQNLSRASLLIPTAHRCAFWSLKIAANLT